MTKAGRFLLLALALVACADDPAPTVHKPVAGGTPADFLPPGVWEGLALGRQMAEQRGDQATWNRYGDALLLWDVNHLAEKAYLVAARLPGAERKPSLYLAGVAAIRFEPERAVGLLTTALSEQDDYAPGHLRLAGVLEQLGDVERARFHYERALAIEASDQAYLGLGRLALGAGDDKRALELLEQAWQRNPGRPEIAASLSQCLRRVGRERDARDVAAAVPPMHRRASFLDPHYEVARFHGREFLTELQRR